MAMYVSDVDAQYRRARGAGAEIVYEPTEMSYGVREFGARDGEGTLWSFMQAGVE
ncbi:glyoxalase/bleomycin resistance/extradiol dioxygenase family protein [Microbacterium sp. SORGH_AS_0888]|uniref:VOC family protein n=1 Tax=Microbacterium sp. SORGH_AS_0888 TaxID=3041791 RepID=UPI00278A59E1|nr:VOC family protein [Microbacterium sp. SORGH_AS_0888]MDQ1130867.1 putative glyoxalase superfamily protein PhnB [Microbacterium sp. SORGH_AS_0888]